MLLLQEAVYSDYAGLRFPSLDTAPWKGVSELGHFFVTPKLENLVKWKFHLKKGRHLLFAAKWMQQKKPSDVSLRQRTMITIEIVVLIELSSALSLSRQFFFRVLRFWYVKYDMCGGGVYKLPLLRFFLMDCCGSKLINPIGSRVLNYTILPPWIFQYVFRNPIFFIRWALPRHISKLMDQKKVTLGWLVQASETSDGNSKNRWQRQGAWISEVGSILPRIYLVSP